MFEHFIKERQQIGEGKMAKVYDWQGYAYKCFASDHPDEWIEYELSIQKAVDKSGLPVIKYYETVFDKCIKMDLIKGKSLADLMTKEKYKGGLDDLLMHFERVHGVKAIELPLLKPYLNRSIANAKITEAQKQLAFTLLDEVPDGDVLCHLDLHPLNIMVTDQEQIIIDWVNAKIGNPIYDYARTYVILDEFAYRLSRAFLTRLKKIFRANKIDLIYAIYIMAIHRLTEHDSNKVKVLIESTYGEINDLRGIGQHT